MDVDCNCLRWLCDLKAELLLFHQQENTHLSLSHTKIHAYDKSCLPNLTGSWFQTVLLKNWNVFHLNQRRLGQNNGSLIHICKHVEVQSGNLKIPMHSLDAELNIFQPNPVYATMPSSQRNSWFLLDSLTASPDSPSPKKNDTKHLSPCFSADIGQIRTYQVSHLTLTNRFKACKSIRGHNRPLTTSNTLSSIRKPSDNICAREHDSVRINWHV